MPWLLKAVIISPENGYLHEDYKIGPTIIKQYQEMSFICHEN